MTYKHKSRQVPFCPGLHITELSWHLVPLFNWHHTLTFLTLSINTETGINTKPKYKMKEMKRPELSTYAASVHRFFTSSPLLNIDISPRPRPTGPNDRLSSNHSATPHMQKHNEVLV